MRDSALAAPYILEVKNLTKVYEGGVVANRNINFAVREGEIHALVGENGAGKSTLMKCLFGIEPITGGELYMNGRPVRFASSKEAIAMGLGMVHQHFMLIPSFTVAENLLLGVEKKRFGLFTDTNACVKAAEEIAAKYHFDIEPRRRVRDIGVGMKQKLEILKALYRGAKVLILDEPTAVLTSQETDQLFEQLLHLKTQGFTVIFISHKLNEVKRLSDRLTILKAGESMGTYDVDTLSETQISALMVGRDITLDYSKIHSEAGETALKAEDIRYTDKFGVTKLDGVSLTVRRGEILGVAGVEGNGQSEFASILAGLLKPDAGRFTINGSDLSAAAPGRIRQAGQAHVPEDRMYNGCVSELPLDDNVIANVFTRFTKLGMMNAADIRVYAEKLVEAFTIKAQSIKSRLKELSGGNIQKTIVAREFSVGANVLLINHPTRGIDVGAQELIHQKILGMRENGGAILLISADLTELLALCDRIVVFYRGKVTGHLRDIPAATEEELGLYMLGLKEDDLSAAAEA